MTEQITLFKESVNQEEHNTAKRKKLTKEEKEKQERGYIYIKKIPKYWATKGINELDLNFDWSDALETPLCFCCASRKRLERAHIIPHSLGGSNDVSNYVILCKDCHNEAPDTTNPDDTWHWIKSHKCAIYFGESRSDLLKSIYLEKDFIPLLKQSNLNETQCKKFIINFDDDYKNEVSSHGFKIKPSSFKYFINNRLTKTLNPKCNNSKFTITK